MFQLHRHTIKAGIIAAITALSSPFVTAQISFGGTPLSFSRKTAILRSSTPLTPIQIRPNFNTDDLFSTTQWRSNSMEHPAPMVIGRAIPTKIDFIRKAQRVQYPDGTVIYTLALQVCDAQANILYYDDFFIPKGAGELYIYTHDRKYVLGKYTHETHPFHGAFATEALPGEMVVMEYFAYHEKELPNLTISSVGHIFSGNGIGYIRKEGFAQDNCTININCPEAADWQAEKAGVVQMIMNKGGVLSHCTGNLLNNTKEDFTPYILSAAHCESTGSERATTQEDLDKWIFTFHYENPTCSNGSSAKCTIKTMVGCYLRTFLPVNGMSDGLLVELKERVPDSYRVYYNGWDREAKLPKKAAAIHHPRGDAKKFSFSNEPPTIKTWEWKGVISGSEGKSAENAHYYYETLYGQVEGGSSGSSLFNEKKLVVGTLTGGGGYCEKQRKYYGKLSDHWDRFKSATDPTRDMAHYLDPIGGGTVLSVRGRWKDDAGVLRPLPSTRITALYREGQEIIFTWAAIPTEHLAETWSVQYIVYRNEIEIARTTEPLFKEPIENARKEGKNGSVSYSVQALFDFHGSTGEEPIATQRVSQAISVGNLDEEVAVKVAAASNGGMLLQWGLPYNLQEIALFGALPQNPQYKPVQHNRMVITTSTEQIIPKAVIVASRFPTEHLTLPQNFYPQGVQKLWIHGVRFVPARKDLPENIRIYTRVGSAEKSARQGVRTIKIPKDWQPGEWITTYLKYPKSIDLNKVLYSGILLYNNEEAPQPVLSYIEGTDSPDRIYEDCTVQDSSFGLTFNQDLTNNQNLFKEQPQGYLAMTLLVSFQHHAIEETHAPSIRATGRYLAAFPTPKTYVIWRNGVEIARVPAKGATLEYKDLEGNSDAQYKVTVLYNMNNDLVISNQEITTEDTPSVYPTQLASDALLYLSNAYKVDLLSVYSLQGELLKTVDRPQQSVSLEELPQGTYLVVLTTPKGNTSYRIQR